MKPITLAGDMTVYCIAELREQLHVALLEDPAAPDAVVLNMEAVSEFDGAGLQLLLALARWARERGREVEICAASGLVLGVLEQFGVTSRFKINAEVATT